MGNLVHKWMGECGRNWVWEDKHTTFCIYDRVPNNQNRLSQGENIVFQVGGLDTYFINRW